MNSEYKITIDLQHKAILWSIVHGELSIKNAYMNHYINDNETMLLIEAKQAGIF